MTNIHTLNLEWVVTGLILVFFLLIFRYYSTKLAKERAIRIKLEADFLAEKLRFSSFAENMPDNIMRHDLDGRIIYVNQHMGKTLSMSDSSLLGRKAQEVFPPNQFPTFKLYQDALDKINIDAQSVQIEIEVPQLEGGTQVHNIIMVPEFDAQGCLQSVVAVGRDITASKKIEEQLRQREFLFRTLAENIPDNIIRHDLECRILYMNPQLQRALNVTLEDVVGKVTYEVFPDDIFPTFKPYHDVLKNIAVTRKPCSLEVAVIKPSGESETRSVSLVPEYDEHGEFCSVLTLGHDITQRKKMENELSAREREFRSLVENIPDNIVRHDLEGHVLYMNRKMEVLMGLSPGQLVGKTIFEIFPPENTRFKIAVDSFRKVLATGYLVDFEVQIPQPSGDLQIHSVRHIPERDEQGVMHGILTVGQDITRQKKMELDLRQRESEFRTLADNFPYLIVRYDKDFRRIYANLTYRKLFNVAAEDILDKHIDESWYEGKHISLDEFKSYLNKVVETRVPQNFYVKWISDTGDFLFREILLVPEFDADGVLLGILNIGHNTNAYEKAMLDLNQLNLKLQSLSASREIALEDERKYIAREIHDELGQLLNVIHLTASTFEYLYGGEVVGLREKAQKIMRVTDQAIESIKNIVTRLRPVIMNHGLIHALRFLVEDFSRNSGIQYELALPTENLKIDESYEIIVFRVVQEALTNIMRHSGANLVKLSMTLQGDTMSLRIEDNGCGFNPNSTSRPDAFGIMGMQERMLALDGEMRILSALGNGTTIQISIPLDHS